MTERPLLVGPVIHLGTLAPFQTLSHAQLTAIALDTEEVVYEEGEWLSRAGESLTAMHMIMDGYASTSGTARSEVVGPGGLIGFPAILVAGPAHSGARADTEVVALRLETDALRHLCEHNFAILASLLSHLGALASDDPRALARVEAGPVTTTALETPIPLDRVGRMLALHRTPALSSNSMDALAELAVHLEPVTLKSGERLWVRDEATDGFWVVCAGEIEVGDRTAEGYVVAAGGVPGMAETLAGRPRGSHATAREETTLLYVAIDPFMDLLEDHFELAFSMLSWLASHLIPTASD